MGGPNQAASAAMERYAQGEDGAFAELYDLLEPRLRGFLLRRTRDEPLTMDLLQQTFMAIMRARGRFLRGADVMPWAFTIAHRLFLDHRRKSVREVVVDTTSDEQHSPVSSQRPDEEASGHELARRAEEAIARLPEAQRLVFELTKLDGFSLAGAAEVLGTTVMAVKMRAFHGAEAIRAALHGANRKKEAGNA